MAVTAPDANLFSVVDLSENVGRLLVGIMGQKGKRVEPERLAKKYGEVQLFHRPIVSLCCVSLLAVLCFPPCCVCAPMHMPPLRCMLRWRRWCRAP